MNIQFPPSLPDEFIVSSASRFHILNDGPTIANTFEILFDSKPCKLTSMIPPYLDRLALKLPGSPAEEIKKLFEQNTLYPLLKIFNGSRIENINSDDLADFKVSSAPKRLVGGTGKTYLCPDCVSDDIKEFGIPYIHRAHQVPGVFVCYKHGQVLLDSCGDCGCPFETIGEFVTVPWHGCVCDQEVHTMSSDENIEMIDIAIGYAKFMYELLQKTDIDVSAKILSETYRIRAIKVGHKYYSSVSQQGFRKGIEEFYGVELLSKIDNAYAKGKTSGWHTHFTEVATHSTPLSRHLLTAYYLFREVDAFVEGLRETEELVSKNDSIIKTNRKDSKKNSSKLQASKRAKKRNSSKPYEDEKSTTFKELEKIYINNPDYNLDDFWENYRVKMKKLVSNHKEEFVKFKELITLDVCEITSGKIGGIDVLDEDSALANKLVMVVNKTYSGTDKPEKITKHRALKAAGLNAYKYFYVNGYPILKQTLDECVESQWHYHARRVLWAKLNIGNRDYSNSEITQISGVNHQVAMRLDNFFKNATKNIPFEQGSIMKILNKYRIELDWEGPAPDTEYHLNGRNYVPVAQR